MFVVNPALFAEGKGRKAYLVWVPAVCPKTGICVWQPHQCFWQGPGMQITAHCPLDILQILHWDGGILQQQRHVDRGEEAAAAPKPRTGTCTPASETTAFTGKNARSSSKRGPWAQAC